tara:strand:+ start:332 stop:622 length:291 start_codon:yes stop_codon:yes gene_type:complete
MIKPNLLLWIGLPSLMTIALLLVSYQVKRLENELLHIEKRALAQQEEIHVLNAEWSSLNRPERIARLATDHLNLSTITPEQVSILSDDSFIQEEAY